MPQLVQTIYYQQQMSYLNRVTLTAPVLVLYCSNLATNWNTSGSTALSTLITMADRYSPISGIPSPADI